MGRNLNRIWGEEQRIADPEKVRQKFISASKNNGKSPLSVALKLKKAIWVGRKSDPYQPIEMELEITRSYIHTFIHFKQQFIICSRYIPNADRDESLFIKAKNLLTFLVEITPGMESDWEIFERRRTPCVSDRLEIASKWMRKGVAVGVRGEPFIPGYHTLAQFRNTIRRVKSFGFKSYNTYNLHVNAYTMRRLHDAGMDIEKIWHYNQDEFWRPIQRDLCRIADEEGIILGCPDFVNTPKGWRSRTNTCCGVDVPGAFTFNTHQWKICLQNGLMSQEEILASSWEGIGAEQDKEMARLIMLGKSNDFYTMGDVEL